MRVLLVEARNRFTSASRKRWRLPAPIASITRHACAAPLTRRPGTNSISARVRSNGCRREPSWRNLSGGDKVTLTR
jgi:hypothetical protein